MATRLWTTSLTPSPSVQSVSPGAGPLQLLPLLLCLCCCVRLCAPLTEANWPQLSVQKVFSLAGLSSEQDYLLRETVRLAVNRLESLLRVMDLNPGEVIRLNRSRSYCSLWLDADRCGVLNETYMRIGETCSTDARFRIPRQYLSEVAVYNHSKAIVDAAGSGGEAGANFILFVATQPSNFCAEADSRQVSGTVCSQQWMARRPLAGLLRVCPELINLELTSRSGRLLQQILAGLIRMLGFSRQLMPDFQRLLKPTHGTRDSDEWVSLSEREVLIRQDGLKFLLTPVVRRFAQRHFNCSIGLPLAPEPSADAWDPVFMLPSVLSSAPIAPGVSGLDEGTLALLEDSGWYTVNYSLADRFTWGHQAGCWFSTNCSTPESSQSSSMFCSVDQQSDPVFKPDYSHRSVGSCNSIAGTNCSTFLTSNDGLCNLTGNWRSLELQSANRTWTECLPVVCPPKSDPSDTHYVVTRNDRQVTCLSNTSDGRSLAQFGDAVQLNCVHINLVCPRQTSVLDLLSEFSWLPRVPETTVGVNSVDTTSFQGTVESSIGGSSRDASSSEKNAATKAGATTSAVAKNSISTASPTAPMMSSIQTTTSFVQAQSLGQKIPPLKKNHQAMPSQRSNPPAKFSIRFAAMDYFKLVNRALVQVFKLVLQKVLAEAFRIAIDQISVIEVKRGSAIAIWENSDPNMDAQTKLQLINEKVNRGAIFVTIEGLNYSATSVEYYTEEKDDAKSFPLLEVVIGSVVGGLLLTGFILVVILVSMKHKLNRPRMQVRPRSEDTTPTTSSQTSRQCSAATSGVVQLATLGSAGVAPSTRAVADVESTTDNARRSNHDGRGGRGRRTTGGGERGLSAGSVGLQFSDSALYFEV